MLNTNFAVPDGVPVHGIRRIFSPEVFPGLVGLVAVVGVVYAISLHGCAATAVFDRMAYEQAIFLRAESLSLMDRAGESYGEHQIEVYRLLLDLERAYAHALIRPGNHASARQWGLLTDPERSLVAGFFARWAERGSLSPTFIDEAKIVVADAFDAIEALERGKLTTRNGKEMKP